MAKKGDKRSPFELVSESLHRVDILFNSKREDLVTRLREGNKAWEQRKKQLPTNEVGLEQRSPDSGSQPAASAQRAQRKTVLKDDEYPESVHVSDLLQRTEGSIREKEVNLSLFS